MNNLPYWTIFWMATAINAMVSAVAGWGFDQLLNEEAWCGIAFGICAFVGILLFTIVSLNILFQAKTKHRQE